MRIEYGRRTHMIGRLVLLLLALAVAVGIVWFIAIEMPKAQREQHNRLGG